MSDSGNNRSGSGNNLNVYNFSRNMAPEDRKLMEILGKQLTLWAFDCDSEKIDNPELIEAEMEKYALAGGMTIKDKVVSKYEPQGVTVALVLQESHLLANSWPENGVLQVELFSCKGIDPSGLEKIACDIFGAKRTYLYSME